MVDHCVIEDGRCGREKLGQTMKKGNKRVGMCRGINVITGCGTRRGV